MANEPLDLRALLAVPTVDPYGGFEFSPDGKRMAFAWNHSGRWEIYELELAGDGPARQITHGVGAKFAPRYAPDGKRLAYVVDLDGSEAFDVWLWERETGEHRNLTPDTPEAIQPHVSWSPAGDQLALCSDRSGSFQAYVMAAEGEARPALEMPYPAWEAHWSPDGSHLAMTVEGRGQDFWTFIVPGGGGEARQVGEEGEPLDARDACWSPDGGRLAFSSTARGQAEIGIYELATGAVRWVTDGPGEKEAPDFSPDGRRLVYVQSEGESNRLAVLDLDSGRVETYAIEPGVHYAPRFSPDGELVAFAFDNPRHPTDLWLLSLCDGSMRQLTDSMPPELQEAELVIPESIRYPSLDGTPVPALLFRPQRADGPTPGVVVVHGGPNWLFQNLWYPFMAHLSSRGWAVLAPNYRGSTGYGRAWQLASRFDLGGVDAMDVAAGADYLAREGLADPKRIAVTGRSHGGYLTMVALTRYPERWAAGSAIVPFLNWFTAHANSRGDLQHWDIQNMGRPEENEALWRERSPFFTLDRVQAPVQLICGANDPRCPASESLAARDALEALGRPVDFALYPDEGHAFLKRENVIEAEVRRAEFLARWIEP